MSYELALAIKEFLTEQLAALPSTCPARKGHAERQRPPEVFIGVSLPPKKQDGPDPYPYVLVGVEGGEGLSGTDVAHVILTCGAYAPEDPESGEAEMLNLTMAVSHALIERNCLGGPNGKRYRLTEDSQGNLTRWKRAEPAAPPYYAAQIYTGWTMPGTSHLEEDHHG
ncbi:MAG: hypothetical protein FD177_2402 [Desulfovibrionaceae bacterium]|nr:MAG: hypothetical protein FD177_2402 [Desulfovibrionaceae bacterium]